MLHEPGGSAAQLGSAVAREHVLYGLPELEGPRLRWRLLGEVVTVSQHRQPAVAVQIVHGAPRANDEVALFPQRAQGRADFDVEVGVEAGVHRHQHRRRAAVREHADQDKVRVVDPVKLAVAAGVEPGRRQHGNAAVGRREVRLELVVDVLGRVDISNRRLGGRRVCGHLDAVAQGVPMRALLLGANPKSVIIQHCVMSCM